MNCKYSKGQTHGQRRRAFTLVEMLLVMAILALMAGLVLPRLAGKKQQANVDAAKTQIASFATVLDMFEVDNNHYPKSLNDLVTQPRDASNWHQYLDKIPNDPWDHPYVYTFPGKHRAGSYDLMSTGPDGRAGTDDDIFNWAQSNAR